ncbi:hypothetical protein OL233_08255 [Vagococcus sp. PNs007]|uniref:Phage protein n=1 Tax=Vagococcus proximus TaxID=2991417 RepID=A0ABT5X2Y3_9ENTE|nr:hypothetical protein [Vagococcus proximus]MDF0480274.1 hypothetical protein [Vagococcus proximus]
MKWGYNLMINEEDLRQVISEQAVEIINLRLENNALKRSCVEKQEDTECSDEIENKYDAKEEQAEK